jgi:co-chaperonin GroES (HSP10)
MNKINWIPHQHRILVKIDEVKTKTGLIELPPDVVSKEQGQQVLATVITVGPTAAVDFSQIKPGSRVMISKWGGATIPGAGNELYRVVNDEDINAIEVQQ